MHFLDIKDLVAFGLTSHRLHANADTDFAWKCHEEYEVNLDSPVSVMFDGVRLARSLLRHLHVNVDVYFSLQQSGAATTALVASIMSIQGIVSLNLCEEFHESEEPEPDLKAVVDHPTAMKDLTVLRLGWGASTVFSEAAFAGKLPSLTHLDFSADSDSWATKIFRFPHLRFLHICGGPLKQSADHNH